MTKEITIAPENLEVANSYLALGEMTKVSQELGIDTNKVSEILNKAEVKRYIDSVFLDSGYRNRRKFFDLLDEIIEGKLEEARESEMFTKMDLMDVLEKVHKMKMAELNLEIKREQKNFSSYTQINTQLIGEGSEFGSGNYGSLMKRLLESTSE